MREMLGVSQDDFASKADRTRSEIKNIEYGKTCPKPEVITAVCKAWGINRVWLVDGIGEPFRPMDRDEQIAAVLSQASNSTATSRDRIIRALAMLPDEMFAQAEAILDAIIANMKKE